MSREFVRVLSRSSSPVAARSLSQIRSLASALVSGDLHLLWVCLTAPVLGASLGGLTYEFVRGEEARPAELNPEVVQREEAA